MSFDLNTVLAHTSTASEAKPAKPATPYKVWRGTSGGLKGGFVVARYATLAQLAAWGANLDLVLAGLDFTGLSAVDAQALVAEVKRLQGKPASQPSQATSKQGKQAKQTKSAPLAGIVPPPAPPAPPVNEVEPSDIDTIADQAEAYLASLPPEVAALVASGFAK